MLIRARIVLPSGKRIAGSPALVVIDVLILFVKYMYQGAALTARIRVTDLFVHGASHHPTMASQPITEHHGTSQESRSESQCITARSRAIKARMRVNLVRVSHAVSHHCQVQTGCQTKTFQRIAPQKITARHGESQSITEITKRQGHHGVHHRVSPSEAHHRRSQHR